MSASRRVLAILLGVLTLAATLSVLTAATTVTATAGSAADPRLGRAECALTGRVFLPGQGCARRRCVAGAVLEKTGRDAELCALRGPKGWAYGQPVDARRCGELGRVWIAEINICASNPDRREDVVPGAPQCRHRDATYVNQSEEEGYFDECLSPRRYREVRAVARREGVSVPRAARDRSRHNCSYRAGWEMRDGVCVVRQGPPPPGDLGGTFMTGDSVSWRADEELDRRVPRSWTLDLRPGRRLDELGDRLAWYRADHGEPDAILIQLGTNRRAGFKAAEFRATMATIAPETPVLMFLPYRRLTSNNAHLVAATQRYARWMRAVAKDRPRTCLADWPAYAAAHPTHLVDGEHPDSRHEDWYARYVVRAWGDCERRLGL